MLASFAKRLAHLFGWSITGTLPTIPKYIIIGAPHTSNWDFILMLLLMAVFKVKLVWMGKDNLFRWPYGFFFKWLGGMPINRRSNNNVVEQAVAAFNRSKQLILAITPEGTRKKTTSWKTGFYYIALGANVPILLGYADYARKMTGFGPLITPTGDIEADFDRIRAFYAEKTGKYPDQTSDIRIAVKNSSR